MKTYKVSEITQYLKQLMDQDRLLQGIAIQGEISNFKRYTSGHCYFTLKDSGATLRSVMFRSRAQYLKFVPKDGMQVIALGRITLFERDGQYQLYADQLIPDGLGELSLAYEQLKVKLQAEGLFDEERKRPLPFLPKRVGMITSRTGAVLHDIVTVSKRRHPGIELLLYPVRVQGQEAPGEIVAAIKLMNQFEAADVLIVGRGGGSLEELWAFNDERVVRAIAESQIPVVSAVGHETDFTLADFAADRRAATPSQAAEFVVPDVQELRRYVHSLKQLTESQVHKKLQHCRYRLMRSIESRALRQPLDQVHNYQQIVDLYRDRLVEGLRRKLKDSRQQLILTGEKLAVLNPLAVLGRGYAIVTGPEGQALTKASQVKPGDDVTIRLQQGQIEAKVYSCKRSDQNA